MLERPPLGRSNRRRGVVRGVFRVANVYASSLGQDKKLPVYSSWSEFYVVTTGQQWPRACQLAGCMRDAAVGGHMYAHGTTGHAWNLLLPICSHHNNSRTLDCVQNRYTTDGALFVNYLPTKLDVYMAVIAEKPEVSLYHDGVLRVRPTRGAAKA